MLEKILIGVAVVLAVFVAVVARRPSAYHVERRLDVAASAELVFAVLNDLHRFAGVWVLFGSPFDTLDPNLQTTFEGGGCRSVVCVERQESRQGPDDDRRERP